ncbi:MAG: hypothetical protein RMJ97_03655 [Raineya sp.]|nr:hypothetical protein [Raineya sp.]MDW8295957.1 hypothetical protein [Raineya sp.]
MLHIAPISKNANIFTHPVNKFLVKQLQVPFIQKITEYELAKFDRVLKEVIQKIADLPENWDAYQASAVEKDVLKNTQELLLKLPLRFKKYLNITDITPTPNGTILLEWNKDNNFLLVDVGKQGITIASNNLQKNVPISEAFPTLVQCLENFYYDGVS